MRPLHPQGLIPLSTQEDPDSTRRGPLGQMALCYGLSGWLSAPQLASPKRVVLARASYEEAPFPNAPELRQLIERQPNRRARRR